LKSVKAFLDLIKFEHTIFALPFAYLGMLVAANGWHGWSKFLWITIAMAAARTLAMALNRILDRRLDALNPRTAQRPLVIGSISIRTAWIGTLLSAAVLVLAAGMLGPLPLKLLPLALVFLVGYSYTKRFTELSHFILGFTDGLAPVGAWVAVRGSLFTRQDLPAWLFLGVVTLWIGGFDLLYACQDVDHDRQLNLYAIPARRGVLFALRLSTFCHVLMAGLLILLGILLGFGWFYWLALLVVAGLLVWEHRLVTPADLSRIGVAFFNVNSLIAVALFIGVLFQYIF
jgi:4-hydroxybenzoate polyprenyltransferase